MNITPLGFDENKEGLEEYIIYTLENEKGFGAYGKTLGKWWGEEVKFEGLPQEKIQAKKTQMIKSISNSMNLVQQLGDWEKAWFYIQNLQRNIKNEKEIPTPADVLYPIKEITNG